MDIIAVTMPESLPPEWLSWVEVNLGRNSRCGSDLFLTLLDRGFHPLAGIEAIGDFPIQLVSCSSSIQAVEICVLIASYRDPECVPTLENLFAQALWPDRVRVAVLSQEEKGEELRLPKSIEHRRSQVTIRRRKASSSKGACWARHHCQKLLQDEPFALQIDSHMRFEKGWDTLLLATWLHCRDPKAVLTAYPAGYEPDGDLQQGVFHGMAAKEFDPDGILLFTGRPRYVDDAEVPKAPKPGAFVSANFLFGPSEYARDVPYDPNIYFFGEEISLSVRLWTNGYNVYHPNRALLYHYWDRSSRTTHFSDHSGWRDVDRASKGRIRALLGIPALEGDLPAPDLGCYGLGGIRSLSEYEIWSGIKFSSLLISASAGNGQFPAPLVQSFNPKAVVVAEDEDIAVVDNFLAEEDYRELREFLVCSDYKHINTAGTISRAWHLQDRFPLRTDTSWIMPANQPTDNKPDWVVPTGTPIDCFMQAVEEFQAQRVPFVGTRGESWSEFSSTGWIYPPGTGLAMHTDGSNVYAGAYVYFLNDTWRSHWGGLLIVMDQAINRFVAKTEEAQDGMRWYRRRWLNENELEEFMLEAGGMGRCIFPKANRIAFLGNTTYHMVTRVNEEAGDCVRLSLAGFFSARKS